MDAGSTPFKGFYDLIGGSLPDSSAILIEGNPGSGKSTLAQQIIHDELRRLNPCVIITYDTPPSNIVERINQFGWDLRSHQTANRLEIVDCYSATAGITEGVVPQPFDLTSVSIYLSTVMAKLGNRHVTVLLDSLMPIFSEAEGKHAVGFLQTISARVKRAGGKLIATLSTGSVQPELFYKVESLVDGVVELRMIEEHGMLRRYLLVRKMDRRQIIPKLVRFDIVNGLGIQLKLSRFGALLKRPLLTGPTGS
jgi:KaiC/GvpD/RAD55 family RecA-like ATPase